MPIDENEKHLQVAGLIDAAQTLGVEARAMLDITDPQAEDYLLGCLARLGTILDDLEARRAALEASLRPPASP